MSFYQKLAVVAEKLNISAKAFRYVFNISPMYKRSTAKVTKVSDDLTYIEVKLPISYKNKNYNGSIFGGSMFSAVDPIPMVQLVNLLKNDYVVWDKSAEIYFKRPAREDIYADFIFTLDEISEIKNRISTEKEITFVKITKLMNKERTKIFCEVHKTIYVADKKFYSEKNKLQAAK